MAVELDIVYQGLLRPTKILGLPVMAAAIWGIASFIIFLWSESFWSLAVTAATYPVLWGLTQWDQHFFDVIAVTTKHFGVAPNKRLWGGYSYGP